MAGHETTLPITLDEMIYHASSVVRGVQRALVVVDLPFGTYQGNTKGALNSAIRIMKESGAHAVKLEGGTAMAETIRFLVRRGIPVVAHVGLTPQAVNALGGYGARGRSEAEAATILADAAAVAEAGAFALVVEGVVESLARRITTTVACPTIGIGASPDCDGQVLVVDDMLGMFERVPRFVERFDDLAVRIDAAAATYASAVRSRRFPTEKQLYL
jgi:3-methyl-2-oxobutanoate hydroxymethyltransferase